MKRIINILLTVALLINVLTPISFANTDSTVILDYDFRTLETLPEYELPVVGINGAAVTTTTTVTPGVSLYTDGGVQALKWEIKNISKNSSWAKMVLPLPNGKTITQQDFPIEIEYSAKLGELSDRRWGQFALMGNTSGTDVTSVYGATNYNSYAELAAIRLNENDIYYTHKHLEKTQIKYNNAALDANKYYVHNFVINADGSYTYKIKEDTNNAQWEELFAGKKLEVVSDANSIADTAGVLPQTITALSTQTGYFNGNAFGFTTSQKADAALEKVDYYRYIKIKKIALELEKTSLPEGENPKFTQKIIKLYFNNPISADTLSSSITLYKGDNQMTIDEDYTLSIDSTDTSVVKVELTENPQAYNYRIIINDNLNKNKNGFIKTLANYQKVIRFYNEQEEIPQVSYGFDFTSMNVGEDLSAKGITVACTSGNSKYFDTTLGIVEDGGVNVLKWTNKNKNDAYIADNVTSSQVQQLFLPAGGNFSLSEKPVIIKMTAKLPNASGFRVIPAGTKTSGGNQNYIHYSTGMYSVSDAEGKKKPAVPTGKPRLASSVDWTSLNPLIYVDDYSANYYEYKFVIHNTKNAKGERLLDIYAKKEGTNNWSAVENMWINKNEDISSISGIAIWTALNTAMVDNSLLEFYIKNFSVEEMSLELEGTNLPAGDNPVFSDKRIELQFNADVSRDTLSSGIKLYKGNELMSSDDYSLSLDDTDKSLVYVDLKDYPEYYVDYKIAINDELNKDKTGFYPTKQNYQTTLLFHNERRATLTLDASTPADGEIFGQRKITLDFSSRIDLASAKENIRVYKQEQQLILDADYSVNLNTSDESVVNVELLLTPEISSGENPVWYKVIVGANLNKNTDTAEEFPADYVEETISFYNDLTVVDYDFTTMSQLPDGTTAGISSGDGATSTVTLGEDDGVQVLRWHRNFNANKNAVNMNLPIPATITKADFPIKVEYSAKLSDLTDRMWGQLCLNGTDNDGSPAKALYGLTTYSSYVKPTVRCLLNDGSFINYANTLTQIKYQNESPKGDKYYVHQFVINADGTYTYNIKEDAPGADWETLFSNYTLLALKKAYPAQLENAGVPDIITSLYSEVRYFSGSDSMTESQLEDVLKDSVDCFKYIKITKHETPAIFSSSISNGDADISENLNRIDIDFNGPVAAQDITKQNITLYTVERNKEVEVDEALYTLTPNDDNSKVTVNINFELGTDKKYVVKVKDLKLEYNGKSMTTVNILSFETAKKYELSSMSVSTSDNKITISGDLRTYHTVSGDNAVIMAVLVDKKGTYHGVKYYKLTVPTAGENERFTNSTYNFELNQPDGFVPQNYKLKFYTLNGLINAGTNTGVVEYELGN